MGQRNAKQDVQISREFHVVRVRAADERYESEARRHWRCGARAQVPDQDPSECRYRGYVADQPGDVQPYFPDAPPGATVRVSCAFSAKHDSESARDAFSAAEGYYKVCKELLCGKPRYVKMVASEDYKGREYSIPALQCGRNDRKGWILLGASSRGRSFWGRSFWFLQRASNSYDPPEAGWRLRGHGGDATPLRVEHFTAPWKPTAVAHKVCAPWTQAAISTVLLVWARSCTQDPREAALPYLPHEIWLLVLQKIPRSLFGRAEPPREPESEA